MKRAPCQRTAWQYLANACKRPEALLHRYQEGADRVRQPGGQQGRAPFLLRLPLRSAMRRVRRFGYRANNIG